jgi:predicted MFS family arabinose efflux permease
MVAEAAPAPLRGTAFGLYNLASGLAMLVGNVAAGLLWDGYGPATAFIESGALGAASLLFLPWTSGSRTVDPGLGASSTSRDAIAGSRQ